MATKPILETSYTNPTYAPIDNPTAGVTDWGENVNQGTDTFPTNASPSWEWTPVLVRTDQVGNPVVGFSGTVGDQHESSADYPFTHPFGYDWNVDVVPDAQYMRLLALGNELDFTNPPASSDPRSDLTPAVEWANAHGLPTKGVMHVEQDRGLISQAYRSRSKAADNAPVHDRVAVFGRWIIDCGHGNFQAEIHPPLLFASARIAGGTTRSTVIGHPCIVGQQWSDGAMLAHLLIELAKLDRLASTRAEAHPTLLPPFEGVVIMSYIVRPPALPAERRHDHVRMVVQFRFTVRTGVTVTLSSYGDGVRVLVSMDEDAYKAAKPQAAFIKHDWNIGLDYLKDTQGPFVAALLGGGLGAVAGIVGGLTGDPFGAIALSVLTSRGILTDRYEQSLAPLVVGANPNTFLLGELPGVTPVTVDDSQPYPICGWIDVHWEGETTASSEQPPLDVLVHVADAGDLIFGDNEATVFPDETHSIQGLLVRFDPVVPGLSMEYMAHLEGTGDTAWEPEGTFVGTRGQSKRLEGFAIRLTGTAAAKSHVRYRATLTGNVDTGWVSDGAFCGTRGKSLDMYSLMVRVTQNLPELTFDLAPVATSVGNTIFVFAKATNGRIYSCQAQFGQALLEWREIAGNGQTDASPCVTAVNGAVFVFIKSLDGRILLNQAPANTNPATFVNAFSGWFEIEGGERTDVGPTAATIDKHVFVFIKRPDQRILVNQADYGQAFGNWFEVQGNGITDKAPAAAVVGQTVFVFIRQLTGEIAVNQAVMGHAFGSWVGLPGAMTTDLAPAATSIKQSVFCFIKGLADHRIYLNQAELGHAFSGWNEVQGNGMTNVTPGAGTVDTSVFVFAEQNGSPTMNQAEYKHAFGAWFPMSTESIDKP